MSRSGALVADWSKSSINKILKSDMKVVILGYSFFGNLDKNKYLEYYGPNSEYNLKMANLFSVYNIKDVKWIYYFGTKRDEAIKLIENADILYFPGGAPDLMMERIKNNNLLDAIKNFDEIIIGSSAGAMIQLENFHISPDNEYSIFSLNQGLGYISDFFIEVHYRRRRKQKSSMRKMRRSFLKPIYTIPDDGMLIINNNKVTPLGSAKKMYNKDGINKKTPK